MGGRDVQRIERALADLMWVNGAVLAGQIMLVRLLAGSFAQGPGQVVELGRAMLLSIAGIAPAAMLCGLEFPMVLRVLRRQQLGTAYGAESWGAAAAGVAFTFVLVRWLWPIPMALVCGAALGAGAFLALSSRWVIWRLWPAALLLGAALLPLERATERLRWRRLEGYELAERRDTPYGRVCAMARQDGSQVAVFHDGALVASLEKNATLSVTRELADFVACLHPSPHRALLLGDTLGSFPRELLRHGIDHVDALELDGALFEVAAKYGAPASDGRIARIAADGRTFLRGAADGQYDLMVISAGRPANAAANRFCTAESYRQARRCLKEGGVLVVVVPVYGSGAEYVDARVARPTAAIWRAMGETFGTVRTAPTGGHVLIARKGGEAMSLQPSLLAERLSRRLAAQPFVRVGGAPTMPVDPQTYFGTIFGGALEIRRSLDGPDSQAYVEQLETALREARVVSNRDEHPAAVAEDLLVSAEIAGGTGIVSFLHAWPGWTIGLPLALVTAAAAVFVFPRDQMAAPADASDRLRDGVVHDGDAGGTAELVSEHSRPCVPGNRPAHGGVHGRAWAGRISSAAHSLAEDGADPGDCWADDRAERGVGLDLPDAGRDGQYRGRVRDAGAVARRRHA